MMIAFDGTAADAEIAFHTSIHNYASASGNFFANASEVQVPSAIAPAVRGIAGLQNVKVERSPGFDGLVSAAPKTEQKPIVVSSQPMVAGVKELPTDGGVIVSAANKGTTSAGAGREIAATVSVNPLRMTYASGDHATVTATIAWSGGAKPTGSIVLSDADGYLDAKIDLSGPSCALGTNSYTCTYAWKNASLAPSRSDAVTIAYAGDANFAQTQSSVSRMVMPETGSNPFPFGIFEVSPSDQTFGTSTPQTMAAQIVGLTVLPTGSMTVSGSGPIGTIYTFPNFGTQCVSVGLYVCEFDITWNPDPLLPVGTYTLTSAYSGDNYYAPEYASVPFTVNAPTGTTTTSAAVSANPNAVTLLATGATFTTVTTWTGAGGNAPGAIGLTDQNGDALGEAAYPAAGAVTSSGSGVYGNGYTYTYACEASDSAQTVTCTITDSDVYDVLPAFGANTVTAAYSGDNSYAGSNGTAAVSKNQLPTSTTMTADTPGSTSGGVTAVNLTATVSAPNGAPASGSVTFTDASTGAAFTIALTNGSAAVNVTTASVGVAAGVNSFSASYNGSGGYAPSGGSTTTVVYLQGLLISNDLKHNFSTNPGTLAGSPVCNGSNGTNGYSCTAGFGVIVTNFTSSAQPLGLNFADSPFNAFSYQTNCPATLPAYGAAGYSCEFIFYYLPPYGDGNSTTVGEYEQALWTVFPTATGVITGIGDHTFTRSGATSFPAVLAGKALVPTVNPISVSTVRMTFGPMAPGQQSGTQNVVLTNAGTASIGLGYRLLPSPFVTTNNCPQSLSAGSSCSIAIYFKSSNIGQTSDSMVITPVGGSQIVVSVAGIVEASTGLVLSTTSHSFGSVTDGTTQTYRLTIANSATSAATVGFSNTGSSEYTVNDSSCGTSIAAGASCAVTVTFAPTAAGAASDVLTVTSNVPILPDGTGGNGIYSDTVSFSGSGVAGGQFTVSTSSHNFGDVTVDSSASNYGVTLTNSTGATITLGLGPMSGSNAFAQVSNQSNCGATLKNGASCQLAFSFTPTQPGFQTATYAITGNGGAVPLYSNAAGADVSGISLSGTGTTNP
jgi:hypothetical protein